MGVLDPRRILVQAYNTQIGNHPDDAQTGERQRKADTRLPLRGYQLSIGGLALTSVRRAMQCIAQRANEHTRQDQNQPKHDIRRLLEEEAMCWRQHEVAGSQGTQGGRKEAWAKTPRISTEDDGNNKQDQHRPLTNP